MADWRDGVEYAPTGRPYGFATPRADPLPEPPPRERTSPTANHALSPTPSSRRRTPPARPEPAPRHVGRDPHAAFDSRSAGFTGAVRGASSPTGPRTAGRRPNRSACPAMRAGAGTDFAPPTGEPVVAVAPAAAAPPPGAESPATPVRRQAPGTYPSPGAQPPPGTYPPGTYPLPAAIPLQAPIPARGPEPQGPSRPPAAHPGQAVGPGATSRPGPLGWLLVALLLGGVGDDVVVDPVPRRAAMVVVRLIRPRRQIARHDRQPGCRRRLPRAGVPGGTRPALRPARRPGSDEPDRLLRARRRRDHHARRRGATSVSAGRSLADVIRASTRRTSSVCSRPDPISRSRGP